MRDYSSSESLGGIFPTLESSSESLSCDDLLNSLGLFPPPVVSNK